MQPKILLGEQSRDFKSWVESTIVTTDLDQIKKFWQLNLTCTKQNVDN